MTGHTPGPWSDGIHHAVTVGGRTFAYILAAGHLVPIAAVPLGVEGYGRSEGEANARLIAAAPDILAALKAIAALAPEEEPEPEDYDDMESAYGNGHEVAAWEAAAIARVIIAKAEGQEPAPAAHESPEDDEPDDDSVASASDWSEEKLSSFAGEEG